jgi:hypothetical protein
VLGLFGLGYVKLCGVTLFQAKVTPRFCVGHSEVISRSYQERSGKVGLG